METKYGFEFSNEIILADKKRLINQLWKILPMNENNEDWKKQLQTVIDELVGLNEIFRDELDFLILLSKLESLFITEDFQVFRKTVFESINLLGELIDEKL